MQYKHICPINQDTSLITFHCPLSGDLLVKEWGTELLADPSFFRTMVTVRLPEGLIPPDGPEVKTVNGQPEYNYGHGSYIGNILHHQYKVEVSVHLLYMLFLRCT